MSELKERLGSMLKEEESGVDGYKEMADLALELDGVTEASKLLIAETFMGIRADEAKHKQLLRFIYNMIE